MRLIFNGKNSDLKEPSGVRDLTILQNCVYHVCFQQKVRFNDLILMSIKFFTTFCDFNNF